jgi:hypothetical protein
MASDKEYRYNFVGERRMNRIIAAVNFCISGYFIVNIIRHMIRPGMNSEYTRMLMFACLATIPLVFTDNRNGSICLLIPSFLYRADTLHIYFLDSLIAYTLS